MEHEELYINGALFSKDFTKCLYYKKDVLPFMLEEGPCWGWTEQKIEAGYYTDEDYYLAEEYWINDLWICNGHMNYYNGGEYIEEP